MTRPRKYMVANNIQKIEERLDNALSELNIALELIGDMDFSEVDEGSLRGIEEEIERLSVYFNNIAVIKNSFEEIREELK